MKTQHIATDLISLSKEQAPEITISVEQFQAAMKTVNKQNQEMPTETMSEVETSSSEEMTDEMNLEVEGIESEAQNELEEKETDTEPVFWMNMGNIRFTETLENQLPILNATVLEITDDSLIVETSIVSPDESNKEQLTEESGEWMIQEVIENPQMMSTSESDEPMLSEEFMQTLEKTLTNQPVLVQTDGKFTNEIEIKDEVSVRSNLDNALVLGTDENNDNLIQIMDQTNSEALDATKISLSTKQTTSEAAIQTQQLSIENNELLEANSEIQVTETTLDMKTEVILDSSKPLKGDDQETPLKTETTRHQPTEITQLGQLNQMRLTPNTPQIENVKVVPQEQWVQEVEKMIVEAQDGPNPTEKVTTTRIQLTPKHLGEMDIELVLKDKGLTARLVVEEMETKQWIEQKLTQLTNQLATQEIKVEEFHIIVASSEQNGLDASFDGQSAFKQREKSSKQNPSFHQGLEEEPAQVSNKQMNRSTAGRISMWV